MVTRIVSTAAGLSVSPLVTPISLSVWTMVSGRLAHCFMREICFGVLCVYIYFFFTEPGTLNLREPREPSVMLSINDIYVHTQGSRVRPIWSHVRPNFSRVRLKKNFSRTGASSHSRKQNKSLRDSESLSAVRQQTR